MDQQSRPLKNDLVCYIIHIVNYTIVLNFQGYLRPSRELLEFYRRKIAQYDNERDDMVQKLDRCKVAYEEKVRFAVFLRNLKAYDHEEKKSDLLARSVVHRHEWD
jgi:hypothetical protein